VSTTPASPPASQANVDAALLVLRSMGLSLEDLLLATASLRQIPTSRPLPSALTLAPTPGETRGPAASCT
jgi:hypothetical protein